MNGLIPWIKAEVEFWEPTGLAQMMSLAQRVENREVIQRETNLAGYLGGKYPFYLSNSTKPNASVSTNENTSGASFPMRTIMLRGVTVGENRKEGPMKRLSDAEFQAKREKRLCFK